jgi:dTDP-4-amino-4,6-dideoxygalactose transaminase
MKPFNITTNGITKLLKNLNHLQFVYRMRRTNWENMKDDLKKLHEDIIKMKDQKSNVNAMWTHFQTKLEKSIDVNVPKKIAGKRMVVHG